MPKTPSWGFTSYYTETDTLSRWRRDHFRSWTTESGSKTFAGRTCIATVVRSERDSSVEDSNTSTTASDPPSHDAANVTIPAEAEHPVLRQVFPDLMANIENYGHPNIPLGTSAGKKCSTLRRLYLQNKLSPNDKSLLEGIGFAFVSFDDIYYEADFDEMIQRLQSYESENQTGYQIPKKYKPDPQLGAWVTNLRRLGPEGVSSEHRQALDDINFAWKSTRACGSSFMKTWRSVVEELSSLQSNAQGELEANGNIEIKNLSSDTTKWLKAQAAVHGRGDMTETRQSYMDKLDSDFGIDWKSFTS